MKFVIALAALCLVWTLQHVSAEVASVQHTYFPVVGNGAAAPYRQDYDLRAPGDLRCFHHDTTLVEAGDGAIYWNSQCGDGAGQIIFRTDAAGTRVIMRAGQGGRGFLFVGRDRQLYIATGTSEGTDRRTLVEPVLDGWLP